MHDQYAYRATIVKARGAVRHLARGQHPAFATESTHLASPTADGVGRKASCRLDLRSAGPCLGACQPENLLGALPAVQVTGCPVVSLAPSGYLKLERVAESIRGEHLLGRLAVLEASSKLSLRIPKREDGRHVVVGRQADVVANGVQACEPGPVGADALRPGGQDHGLDCAADIGDRDWIVALAGHHYRRRRT